MARWLEDLATWQVLLLVAGVVLAATVLAALALVVLVRIGMHRPWVVRRATGLVVRSLEVVKQPLTVVVLDEVAAVVATGHYTRNVSDALRENHDELKALVAEKVAADPNARLVSRLPGYDTLVSEVTETTLRVVIDMLGDPRTDELVSDLLRNNLQQIRAAVHAQAHHAHGGLGHAGSSGPTPSSAPPGPGAAGARELRTG